MLAELGINFEVEQTLIDGYGGGHSNLIFRYDKYLVMADSVTSILHGDMIQAKLNQPLKGLKCINKNENTKEEFKKIVSRVYSMAADREYRISTNDVEKIESFDDILNQYTNLTDNIKPVSINDKFDILIDRVNSTKLSGIDAMAYILQLKNILFTEDERKNNFRVSIIRDTVIDNRNEYASANAIFALRTIGEDNKYHVKYHFYSPSLGLKDITKEELESLFKNNSIGYVEKDDPNVPGIRGGR